MTYAHSQPRAVDGSSSVAMSCCIRFSYGIRGGLKCACEVKRVPPLFAARIRGLGALYVASPLAGRDHPVAKGGQACSIHSVGS